MHRFARPVARVPRSARALVATVAALPLLLLTAPSILAHAPIEAGGYHLEIGWLNEPALVGQPNAVQLSIHDHDDAPVTDLGAGGLSVVVSTGGQDSDALVLLPAFDAEEGEGPLGEYHAALVPTAPGDYTFHVSGSVQGTTVDVSVDSGEETFDPVEGSSDLEFPVKQPTLTEVQTRLDRIDSRIEALASAGAGGEALAAAQAATTAAGDATRAADRALLVGALVGGAGLVVAVAALAMVMRSRRSAG